MRTLLLVSATVITLALGCAQSDQGPPGSAVTPTPDDKITEMDFESGDVEQPADVKEGDGAEATPDDQ